MNVDLPTPGTPEMPTRGTVALPADAPASSATRARAAERWSGRDDSTSVIARATAPRLPSRTCSTSAGTSGDMAELLRELLEQAQGGVGDDGARREDRRGAHLVQGRHVVGRDDPADDDHD